MHSIGWKPCHITGTIVSSMFLQSAAYSEPISTNSIPIDAYFKYEFNGSIFIAIEQKLTKLFCNHWAGQQNLPHLDRTLHKLYLCVDDSATKLIPIDAHF